MKGTLKKSIISTCMVLVMLSNIGVQVFAANDVSKIGVININENSFESNGYTYTETRTPDGQITLISSKDGLLNDRVIMQIGSDEFTYETFDNTTIQSASASLATAQPQNVQTLKFSDYITPVITPASVDGAAGIMAAASAPLLGSIGSVYYTGSTGTTLYNHSISFTSSLAGSKLNHSFNVNAPSGTAYSVLLAAVLGGFGYLATGALAAAALSAIGFSAGQATTSAFTTTIYGDLYTYSILAIADDNRRVTVSTGQEYFGDVIDKNGKMVSTKLYTGAHPHFITQKDRQIALSFYMEFWMETTIVINW